MRLSDLFGTLKIKAAVPDREISGVTCSTDKVKEGGVYFAFKGSRTDGHLFAGEALKRGAAAVIGDGELSGDKYFRVENARKSYALAAREFYGRPDLELGLCGVTGTNGKTTVASMIRSAAVAAGLGCGLVGTVENIAGGRRAAAERTTPAPEELYRLLREMADSGDRLCVMEVSSHALAEDRVLGMSFDVGVFTNLTRDHLDYHGTMDNYAAAKGLLMENSRLSVINADDPRAPYFLSRAGKATTYGVNAGEFRAENITVTPEGVGFDCPTGRIHLPPGGRFSVYNGLAAICAAIGLGIPEKSVLRGMSLFGGVTGRMELLPTKGKYRVYIDYAHTPDGLEKTLSALREFAAGRIITVFGCGGDRDRTKRPIMGKIASSLSDLCVVTSDNPRTEDPMEIINGILEGVSGEYIALPDRREAIRAALEAAGDGDVVLLAGKGHETSQIVGGESLPLDERELVREIENEKI